MLARELDFALPPELIAQTPAQPRDASRLLRVRREHLLSTPASWRGALSHHLMRDLPLLLQPGDLLVFNDSRVLRARLRGRKPSGGAVEMLLLKECARNEWEALLRPSARLREGGEVLLGEGVLAGGAIVARLQQRLASGWRVQFEIADDIRDLLPVLGEVPTPPYIQTTPHEEQYQTVFARAAALPGAPLDSAAAPTAGLHFTPELLEKLQTRGVASAHLTLAVGAGTFRPVQTDTLEEHVMHVEEFAVSEATARLVNAQKKRGGRVVAVGTTSVRVLETLADEEGFIRAGEGRTAIFLRPGDGFRCVDALLTNFHLPRSTLLALVAAFVEYGITPAVRRQLTGTEIVRYAYRHAIGDGYRFFSFGDAMLIE